MQVLAGAGLRGCDGSSRLETISLCFGKGFPKSSCSPGQGGAAVLCEARMLPCLIFGGCHLWFRIPGLEDAARLANPWHKPECLYWIVFYHLWVCHHLEDLPLLWQRQRSSPRADSWGSGSMWDLGIKMEPHRECLLPKWIGPNWAEKNSEQMWMSLKLWCLGFCGSGWNPSMPAGIVLNFICPLWGFF